jgi:hypothetical protein
MTKYGPLGLAIVIASVLTTAVVAFVATRGAILLLIPPIGAYLLWDVYQEYKKNENK